MVWAVVVPLMRLPGVGSVEDRSGSDWVNSHPAPSPSSPGGAWPLEACSKHLRERTTLSPVRSHSCPGSLHWDPHHPGPPPLTPAQKAFQRPHKTRKTCSNFSILPAFLFCLQPEVSPKQRVQPLRLILPVMTSDFLAMFLFYKWAVPKITRPGCPAAPPGLCVSSWVRRPASPSAGFFWLIGCRLWF